MDMCADPDLDLVTKRRPFADFDVTARVVFSNPYGDNAISNSATGINDNEGYRYVTFIQLSNPSLYNSPQSLQHQRKDQTSCHILVL